MLNEWIMDWDGATCPNCGHKFDISTPDFNVIPSKPWWNFCPNCGVQMNREIDKASSCADCKHSKRLLFCTHPNRWLHEVDLRNFCDELERGTEE